ncbi:MAG TPA: lysophospholipase [Chthoniobacterales bacterium]|jgi:acylglycerol lipase|nr:lysophospholipase [Chthoniobacterales bacterium]
MSIDSKMTGGYSTETVPVADGLALFCRKWEPSTPALASVVIVHGLGEHSGRYVHVGRYFSEAGFRTIAFDLRGHGRSPGRPAFVKRYIELASDVDCIVKRFSEGPTFLFGHSLGGQLVLWTAQHFRLMVVGLIVSAPWLALAFAPPRWQLFVAQKVNGLIPSLRFSTRIRSATLSRDQAHLDSLEDLDLLHKFSTVRLYLEAANAASEIVRTPLIDRPILFAYGDADGVTSWKVAEDYFERLRAPSKTFKTYPGLLHELHNETEREQVLADYVKWMKSVLQTGSAELAAW